FDWSKFDPIVIWKDPQLQKYFVLSGHSRLAAFKELAKTGYIIDGYGLSNIPVKVFKGSESEAIDFALNSNTLSTKETEVERALYYAKQRNLCERKQVAGLGVISDCEKEVIEKIKNSEGKNSNYIINLSYLNPEGFLMQSLTNMGVEKDNDSTNVLRTIANWIGEARKNNAEILNTQEDEIAKFLLNGGYGNKSGQFKNKVQFNERLKYSFDRWKAAGADPSRTLNLANTLSKSTFEQDYDLRLARAKEDHDNAIAEHSEKYNKYLYALLEGSITQERMDELMKPILLYVEKAKSEYERIRKQKETVRDAAKNQLTLFGIEGNSLYGLEFGNTEDTEIDNLLGATEEDTYNKLTDLIIKKISEKPLFWRKAWHTKQQGYAYNFESKKTYSGVNFFVLNFLAPLEFMDKGYESFSDAYLTFKQMQELGGKVKKGATGFPVFYYNMMHFQKKDGKLIKITKEEYDALDNENRHRTDIFVKPFVRYYTVFNAIDLEGIDFPKPIEVKKTEKEQINSCEFVLDAYSDKPEIILSKEDRAYYTLHNDKISMPYHDFFESMQEYYSTLFHELTHSTGHSKRLNRDMSGKFGTPQYALEELIAELTALFLCADTGIAYYTMDNSAAYIQGWNKSVLKLLKEDNKAIFKAAAEAQKAHDYMLKGKKVSDLYNNDNVVIKPFEFGKKTKGKEVEHQQTKKPENKKKEVTQLSLFGTNEFPIIVGQISKEIADEIKKKSGLILLEIGNDSFGYNHLIKRHKDDIEQTTLSVIDYVKFVCNNFNEIRIDEKNPNSLILVYRNGLAKIAFIRMNYQPDNEYYGVRSGYPTSYNRLKKKRLLWSRFASDPT
ncbi:MAG: DUF1738 domain-containing protein, partial [Bacteroidales bacterium]|nr:DUF1738 domain-containing protein [Bacteroidales bacterium]